MADPPVSATLRLQPEFKSIGRTAEEAGLSASAIRYYEREGFIRAPRAGGRRWFGPAERVRLQMIARLRGAGFSLTETAALLSPSTDADRGWRAAAKAVAERLRREVAEREAILTRIETMSRCTCSDPIACREAQTA